MKRSMIILFPLRVSSLLLGTKLPARSSPSSTRSNYAAALQEFHQLQQTYTTALRDPRRNHCHLQSRLSDGADAGGSGPDVSVGFFAMDKPLRTGYSTEHGRVGECAEHRRPGPSIPGLCNAVVQVENFPN